MMRRTRNSEGPWFLDQKGLNGWEFMLVATLVIVASIAAYKHLTAGPDKTDEVSPPAADIKLDPLGK